MVKEVSLYLRKEPTTFAQDVRASGPEMEEVYRSNTLDIIQVCGRILRNMAWFGARRDIKFRIRIHG